MRRGWPPPILDQSANPVIAAPTAPTKPTAIAASAPRPMTLLPVFSSSTSRSAAAVQEPSGTSVNITCNGCPNQVPCRISATLGPIEPSAPSAPAIIGCSRSAMGSNQSSFLITSTGKFVAMVSSLRSPKILCHNAKRLLCNHRTRITPNRYSKLKFWRGCDEVCVQSSVLFRLRRSSYLYKTSVQFGVSTSALMDGYEEQKDAAFRSAGTRCFCLRVICRQCNSAGTRKSEGSNGQFRNCLCDQPVIDRRPFW